ncbi:MAG: SDR family oxidoreductase [Vulcanimicrobiaceae bacterium]
MRERALITGASGGIGLELATLFARDGFDLILVARSGDKLETIAADFRGRYGIGVQTIAKDLSVAGSGRDVFDAVGSCDILINNAGFPTYGKFAELDLNVELEELRLNVLTLTELTGLFLPGMVTRGKGRILNVASTAAFQPGPMMAVYYASKAYVLSFSEAIAEELRGTGVTVTCLAPGATRTGFQERSKMGDTLLFRFAGEAGSVAKAGYVGLMKGRTLVIPGFKNTALALGARMLPRSMMTKLSRAANERR